MRLWLLLCANCCTDPRTNVPCVKSANNKGHSSIVDEPGTKSDPDWATRGLCTVSVWIHSDKHPCNGLVCYKRGRGGCWIGIRSKSDIFVMIPRNKFGKIVDLLSELLFDWFQGHYWTPFLFAIWCECVCYLLLKNYRVGYRPPLLVGILTGLCEPLVCLSFSSPDTVKYAINFVEELKGQQIS